MKTDVNVKIDVQTLLPLEQYTMLSDSYAAMDIYKSLWEQHGRSWPKEFYFATVFFLGKVQGYREARAKRRRS